jgi:hypothetical protein
VNDGGDVEDEAVETAVQQLLTRDEARVVSVAAVVVTALGLIFSLMWLFVAWRTQSKLTGGSRFAIDDTSDPDLVDRVVALVQDGPAFMLSLLVLAAGSGLRLLAGRLLSQRQLINELDTPGTGTVHEVTLQPEA